MIHINGKLTRIGVFYDGNYFSHVSNYYHFNHERRSRLSVSGLHNFIRHEASKAEGTDIRYCQIVDAHYFRGRIKAVDADQRGMLLRERIFDDTLVREGGAPITYPWGLPVKKVSMFGWLWKPSRWLYTSDLTLLR